MENQKEKILKFLENHIEINLQIMGIQEIGLQGQVFDEKCLALIKFFKENINRENLFIQIDGGVNEESILKIRRTPVSKIVVGSYLMKFEGEDFVNHFKTLIK